MRASFEAFTIKTLKKTDQTKKVRINETIRARELRVIDDTEGNLGVISLEEALERAKRQGLDLIEVSPEAKPPVAKITDYGKYQYDMKKKASEIKARSKGLHSETKSIQVKVGTGEGDLGIKAKKASKWLNEGHRIKVELFLRGRVKYLGEKFHKERLQRILDLLEEPYKIVDDYKKSPKGLMITIERDKSKKKEESKPTKEKAPDEETKA